MLVLRRTVVQLMDLVTMQAILLVKPQQLSKLPWMTFLPRKRANYIGRDDCSLTQCQSTSVMPVCCMPMAAPNAACLARMMS